MDKRQLDEVFGIRPVPRRQKNGAHINKRTRENERREMHSAAEGNICIYVIGPEDEGVSKVGVSGAPYRRLLDLGTWNGLELRMCYFAEVSRGQGFAIEAAFHRQQRSIGNNVKGEWVKAPRESLTKSIRSIMADLGIAPVMEVGDTGEREVGSDASENWCRKTGYNVPVKVGKSRRVG